LFFFLTAYAQGVSRSKVSLHCNHNACNNFDQ